MTSALPAWFAELDLHEGPPDASMGTRSLDDEGWLVVGDDARHQRAEARRLLGEDGRPVLADDGSPGLAAAEAELAARLDRWIEQHDPAFADGDEAASGEDLRSARARVAEDLCLLLPGPDGWRLAAGAVCFPSHWHLSDKVGRPLSEVHGPVPGYPGRLAARVETFLGRLRPGSGVWRRNWSVHDDDELFVPSPRPLPRPTAVPEGRWLRSEYQTLVRLEASAVVFTIRTQQCRLDALSEHPSACATLAGALRGWSDEVHRYKGGAVDEALLRWLDAHAGMAVTPAP